MIWYEPRHDKTNKMSVRPVKTQISLGIRPVWSESSLSAWRKLGSLATHWAHCEDSDQTGWMPRLIWVFAGRTLILLVLSCRGSYNVWIWDIKFWKFSKQFFTHDDIINQSWPIAPNISALPFRCIFPTLPVATLNPDCMQKPIKSVPLSLTELSEEFLGNSVSPM